VAHEQLLFEVVGEIAAPKQQREFGYIYT